MIEDYLSSGERLAKLEKQRELLLRKQKEKHAHQVLSLHETSANGQHSKKERIGKQKKNQKTNSSKEENIWTKFAYDGPQSLELVNPDEISYAETQVIRVKNSANGNEYLSRNVDLYSSSGDFERCCASSELGSPGITRSSTVLSSLDQDSQLEATNGEEELRQQGNVDFADRSSVSQHETASVISNPTPTNNTSTIERIHTLLLANDPTEISLLELQNCPYDNQELLPPASVVNSLGDSDTLPLTSTTSMACDALEAKETPERHLETPRQTSRKKTTKPKTPSHASKQSTSSTLSTPEPYKRPVKPRGAARDSLECQDSLSKNDTESARPSENSFEPAENLELFVLQPAPKGVTVRCRITRDKHGVDRGIFPTYYLHMEREERKFFLLAARRRKRSATSNYVISCDATDLSRRAGSFVGKLRSNFLGTQFVVYGDGPGSGSDCDNIRKRSKRPDIILGTRSRVSLRSTESNFELNDDSSWTGSNDDLREMAVIIYDTNVLGFKGPRKMTVLIPQVDENGQRKQFSEEPSNRGLIEVWKQRSMHNLLELHNKNPIWNEETQSYVLNFYGRVTQASVKNFQIVHEEDLNNIIMQFGRVAEDVFTMDYSYPMCALQAFGIALSSFDGKLACE